eukprot:479565-Pleurochrysis_carterae.AAC.1
MSWANRSRGPRLSRSPGAATLYEAQEEATANGGRRTGVSCGASLRASLVFLRDRMGLDIDMDKL